MSNTPTPKDPPKVNVVHDFDALVTEAVAGRKSDPIVFKVGDETFRVAAVLDWPDEVVEMQTVAATNPAAFPIVDFATTLLGDQYPAFKAAGGNAMKFMRFMETIQAEPVGESSAS